jgi:hypothetical protein
MSVNGSVGAISSDVIVIALRRNEYLLSPRCALKNCRKMLPMQSSRPSLRAKKKLAKTVFEATSQFQECQGQIVIDQVKKFGQKGGSTVSEQETLITG